MMTLKRIAPLLLVAGLIALPLGTLSAFAADQAPALHVASSDALHGAVQSHAAKVAEARRHIAGLLDHSKVPAAVKQRVAVLSDSEILELERQVMPHELQIKAAGMENKYLIPVLAGVSAGLAVGMFMFAY